MPVFYVVEEDVDYNNFEIRYITLTEEDAHQWCRIHVRTNQHIVLRRYTFEGGALLAQEEIHLG